ncbi:MAG TPA: AmmeMemoRadiSam system radical SAM enzyme, partial [Burkholderiales bacterium]|nr:AmmeMemoRadiSam system radical SAM enzyme [Burkholderiales bacterium]
LKAFRDETYRKVCGARLEPVLETIRLMRKLGVWVEVTTLVVPGLNDGDEELNAIARFIAGLDADIPWHISRFHPDFEYTDTPPTPVKTLRKACEIGRRAGLRFLYVGNLPGESEDTLCPTCGASLVRRRGFFVVENRLAGGACPSCGQRVAGVFD